MSATLPAETRRKFEALLDAEFEVRSAKLVLACGTTGKSKYGMGRESASLKAAKGRFDKAFAALSMDEMAQFGDYRRESMGL